ncbi:MAG: hypothetical protein PHX70_09145 [Clostridium sp.]|nr:hypothetical protein [Clostridium sp.]
MEKESINIKRVILLAGALCAYWIGSGFSTGQEVLQFFAASGSKGIAAALVFLVITLYLTYTLFSIGQKKKFKNPYDVFQYYCGKVIGEIYTWYSVILIYAIFVVMLAGGGATIHQYYGISTYIGTWTIAVLALGTTLLGVEKLIDIIGVIGPIKILFVAVIGVAGISTLVGKPTLLSDAARLMPTLGFKAASSNWAWSGALYAFLALMVSITFQVQCGTSAKSLKEAKIASIIATIAFTLAIVLLVISELVYYKLIVGQQVPTLAIAKHVSPVLGFIFSILIVVSIYSAVASFLLITVRKFAVDRTKKFNIIATILTAIGMLFGGIIPFDKLVNILYPIAGYSAIVFAGFVIFKEVIKKDTNKEAETSQIAEEAK